MMQDIEKLFRESLSDTELPYEAGAWEAMSAKLGPPKAPSSGAKWYIAAAAVAVVAGIAAIAAFNKEKPAVAKTSTPAPVAVTSAAKPGITTIEHHANTNHASGVPVAVNQLPNTVAGAPVNTPVTNPEIPTVMAAPASNPGISTPALPEPEDRKSPAAPAKLLAVSIPAHICSNEPVVISNPNASDLWVKLPGEEVKAVKGKQKATFTASKSGEIIINNGELTQKIEVSQAVSPDITGYNQLIYESGVPQLSFSTSAKLENAAWSSSVPAIETSEGFIVHPYHEDKVTVKLSGTDLNGCRVTEERTITIPEPHNLLAPEVFRPEGNISVNQSFMPFTLLQRDTPFELFIFDVKNGAQVFSTRDASRGWDGHDSRNGELVPLSSVWVWKVVLKNPLPGEAPVYSGTITRL